MDPPPPKTIDWLADITEEQARDALFDFVSEHCCYGRQCAGQMTIEKLTTTATLHYILETFTESRDVSLTTEPYRGQPVDGPQNGPSPLPSSLSCAPNSNFLDHTKKVEIPHTSTVKNCDKCFAVGNMQCETCSGLGVSRCKPCDGVGRLADPVADGSQRTTMCSSCRGLGRVSCTTCNGTGRHKCAACDGHRLLRCYQELTVTFKNNVDDFILGKPGLPERLVRAVRGKTLFEQTDPQVTPLTAQPQPEINQISASLIEEHRNRYLDSTKLMQRHRLHAIPVTKVVYTWREVTRRYWVYGKERRVHAPDYPQKCCWGWGSDWGWGCTLS